MAQERVRDPGALLSARELGVSGACLGLGAVLVGTASRLCVLSRAAGGLFATLVSDAGGDKEAVEVAPAAELPDAEALHTAVAWAPHGKWCAVVLDGNLERPRITVLAPGRGAVSEIDLDDTTTKKGTPRKRRARRARLIGVAAGDDRVALLFSDGSVATLRLDAQGRQTGGWLRGKCGRDVSATPGALALCEGRDAQLFAGGDDGTRCWSLAGDDDKLRDVARLRVAGSGAKAAAVTALCCTATALIVADAAGRVRWWDADAHIPLATWRWGVARCLAAVPGHDVLLVLEDGSLQKGSVRNGTRAHLAQLKPTTSAPGDDGPVFLLAATAGATFACAAGASAVTRIAEASAHTQVSSLAQSGRFDNARVAAERLGIHASVVERLEFGTLLAHIEGAADVAALGDVGARALKLLREAPREHAARAALAVAKCAAQNARVSRFALDLAGSALDAQRRGGGGRDDVSEGLSLASARVDEWVERLGVFERALQGQGVGVPWSDMWRQFRDGDPLDHLELACRGGALEAAMAVWELCAARIGGGGSRSRAKASRRVVEAVAALSPLRPADVPKLVHWLCDAVAPMLRGSALQRLREWAVDAAREIEAGDGGARTADDALFFASELCAALETPLRVGTVASGSSGDAWLVDETLVDENECASGAPDHGLEKLAASLRCLVQLRDDHGVEASLATYEATDKATIARALLERVHAPELIRDEVRLHVRPICAQHGLSADDVLLSYVVRCAEALEAARDNAALKAERAVAVLHEISAPETRARGALALLRAARAPFAKCVVELATEQQGTHDGEASASLALLGELRDVSRVVRLAHLAHSYAAKNFDAGQTSHARRLLRRIVAGTGGGRQHGLDRVVADAKLLIEAFPASLSLKAALVLLVENVVSRGCAVIDAADVARRCVAVVEQELARGYDRESACREVVAFSEALVRKTSNENIQVAAAAVGSALAETLGAVRLFLQGGAASGTLVSTDDVRSHAFLSRALALRVEFKIGWRSDLHVALQALDCVLSKTGRPLDAAARARTEDRLAALLEAPKGQIEYWRGVDAAGRGDFAAVRKHAANVAGQARDAQLLRNLALALLGKCETLEDVVCAQRRGAARYALAHAAALGGDGDSAGDAVVLEALRLVDAVCERCVGAANNGEKRHYERDGLLLDTRTVAPLVSRVAAAAVAHVYDLPPMPQAINLDEGISLLVEALAKNLAWRLTFQVLSLRAAAATFGHVKPAPGRVSRPGGARCLLEQLRLAYADATVDTELCVGLALAVDDQRAAFAAYRDAIGATSVGGSEGDLLKLGALAGVGACVASCLDDPDLRVACGSLAHDARWWRELRRRKIPFDHSALKTGGAHATFTAAALTGHLLDRGADLDFALGFAAYYGVAPEIAASGFAVRLLSKGAAYAPRESTDKYSTLKKIEAEAKRALDLVPWRRVQLLAAALAGADATAYARLELVVAMALRALDKQSGALGLGNGNGGPTEPLVCAPETEALSTETLKTWLRVLKWLRSVDVDASTTIGVDGARRLGSAKLDFHQLVKAPLETLDIVLCADSVPRLGGVARCLGLAPGALWVALARSKVRACRAADAGARVPASAWECLDHASHRQPQLAYDCAQALCDDGADAVAHATASRHAAKYASAWLAAAPRNAAAVDAAAKAKAHDDAALRRITATCFGVGDLAVVRDEDSATALRRMYRAAADAAADSATREASSRYTLWRHARAAHRAAALFAARSSPDPTGFAEGARRELARSWLFDDDDDEASDDVDARASLAPPGWSLLEESALERRDAALARAAIRIAFVLSERDEGLGLRGDDEADSAPGDFERGGFERARANEFAELERAVARPVGADAADVTDPGAAKKTAVDLLLHIAAAVGGPGDEADGAEGDAEAGARERLGAQVRLRALRAAAVLAPPRQLAAAWRRYVAESPPDDGAPDAPATLLALSRRLRVVAELSAMRLPHARVVAARGVACGVGVHAVVETLLRDHVRFDDAATSARVLALAAAILLEAHDDGSDDEEDAVVGHRHVGAWGRLLAELVRFGEWRGLLAVCRRLAARRWLKSALAEALDLPFRALVKEAADQLRSSPAAAGDAARAMQVSVLRDVVSVARAVPHFLTAADRADLSEALRLSGGELASLADAIDGVPDARGPPRTPREAKTLKAPRLSL